MIFAKVAFCNFLVFCVVVFWDWWQERKVTDLNAWIDELEARLTASHERNT